MTEAGFIGGYLMNEDVVNMEIRKFLKKVGITSQREIEKALQDAAAAGKLEGTGPLKASMTLEIGALGLVHTVDGKIALE
jgi:ribulose 1,5-bisphosphate synthetase/thiazole synthase